MWPAKVRRSFVVASCLVLAAGTSLLLRWTRPIPAPSELGSQSFPCTTLPEQGGWVMALAFSPRSDLLACGITARRARCHVNLYGLREGQWHAFRSTEDGPVCALAFSPDGGHLAVACRDGAVAVRDLAGGTRRVLRKARPHLATQLVFSPDGKALAVGSYHDAVAWDLASGAGESLPGRFPVTFSKEGRARATAFGDGIVLAVAPDGKARVREEQTPRGTVSLWEIEPPRLRWILVGHEEIVNAVAFSPDNQVVATASNDRTVNVWDVVTGRLRATLAGHAGAVYCVAFSPDGRTLATGGFDKTVRLWHLDGAIGGSNPGPKDR